MTEWKIVVHLADRSKDGSLLSATIVTEGNTAASVAAGSLIRAHEPRLPLNAAVSVLSPDGQLAAIDLLRVRDYVPRSEWPLFPSGEADADIAS